MRNIFAIIRTLGLAAAFLLPGYALASQGDCVLPTTGIVSGLTIVQDVNTCNDAIQTANSGGTAPTNIVSGPKLGQPWLDTTTNTFKRYDGTNWLFQGVIDAANHVWIPPIGGGVTAIASATTTDLCSVPESLFLVTGTVTITGFGSSCVPGILKTLVFEGILTLTNGANLVLPFGGSNITTAANDRALVSYAGVGKWNVIAYQRIDGKSLSQPGGTVTSVAASVPAELSVAGSPITTTGTLAFTWASDSGSKFIGTPSGGGSGAYGGRALVSSDIQAALTPSAIPNGAKMLARWVNCGSSPCSVLASFNVASVTRSGTGVYTVNYTAAISGTTYCGAWSGTAGVVQYTASPISTSVQVGQTNLSATPTDTGEITVVCFGG